MRSKRVYVAAPYTYPDPAVNVGNACEAAEEIMSRTGWLPFVPHLFHLWHLIIPHPYEFWMNMDENWMQACHALVRLPGESEGADVDMSGAVDLGIPVLIGLEEFIEWAKEA